MRSLLLFFTFVTIALCRIVVEVTEAQKMQWQSEINEIHYLYQDLKLQNDTAWKEAKSTFEDSPDHPMAYSNFTYFDAI